MPKFLRRGWKKCLKLGRNRKDKQKWRRPTGRDNKMREKRKGYDSVVSVGYKQKESERGKIKSKEPIKINNIKDLRKIKANHIAVLGRLGKRKKIEIAQESIKNKIKFSNFDAEKFLELNLKKDKK